VSAQPPHVKVVAAPDAPCAAGTGVAAAEEVAAAVVPDDTGAALVEATADDALADDVCTTDVALTACEADVAAGAADDAVVTAAPEPQAASNAPAPVTSTPAMTDLLLNRRRPPSPIALTVSPPGAVTFAPQRVEHAVAYPGAGCGGTGRGRTSLTDGSFPDETGGDDRVARCCWPVVSRMR